MEPMPKRAKHDLHCPVQEHEQQQQEHHDMMITVDVLDRPHTSHHDSSSCFADGNIISTAAQHPRNTSPPKIVDSKTSTSTHHQKKLVVLLQQEEQESSRTTTRRTAPDIDLEEEQEATRNITTSSAALLLLARQKEEKHCEIKNKQRQLLVVRKNHDDQEQQEMMKDKSLKPAPLKIPAGSNNCDENMRVLVPQDEQYDGGHVHNDKKQEHVLQEQSSPREVTSTKTNSNNEDEKQSSITMSSEPNDDNKLENVVSSSVTMQDSIQTKESFSSDDSIEDNIFLDGPKKFPIKLMAVLSSSKHKSIISWTDGGTSFTIHQPKEFVAHILPKFFRKSSKFHSFIRKLYRWGFAKKMDTKHKPNQHSRGAGEDADSKTYFHPKFRKGDLKLCLSMRSYTKWTNVARYVDESRHFYDQDMTQTSFRGTDHSIMERRGSGYHADIIRHDGTYGAGKQMLHQGNGHRFLMERTFGENTFPNSNVPSQLNNKPTISNEAVYLNQQSSSNPTMQSEALYLNQSPHIFPTHTLLVSTDNGTRTLQHCSANNSYNSSAGTFSMIHHHPNLSAAGEQNPIIMAHTNAPPQASSHGQQFYLIPSARNDFVYHHSVVGGVNLVNSNINSTNIAMVDPSKHHQLVYHVQAPSSLLTSAPPPSAAALSHPSMTSFPFSDMTERRTESNNFMNSQQYADSRERFFQQVPQRHQYPPK